VARSDPNTRDAVSFKTRSRLVILREQNARVFSLRTWISTLAFSVVAHKPAPPLLQSSWAKRVCERSRRTPILCARISRWPSVSDPWSLDSFGSPGMTEERYN